jgi:hypothetical protein
MRDIRYAGVKAVITLTESIEKTLILSIKASTIISPKKCAVRCMSRSFLMHFVMYIFFLIHSELFQTNRFVITRFSIINRTVLYLCIQFTILFNYSHFL